MKAAAGSSGLKPPPERSSGGVSAGGRRYADEDQHPSLPDDKPQPGRFHSCWIVSIFSYLLEKLSVVWWLSEGYNFSLVV